MHFVTEVKKGDTLVGFRHVRSEPMHTDSKVVTVNPKGFASKYVGTRLGYTLEGPQEWVPCYCLVTPVAWCPMVSSFHMLQLCPAIFCSVAGVLGDVLFMVAGEGEQSIHDRSSLPMLVSLHGSLWPAPSMPNRVLPGDAGLRAHSLDTGSSSAWVHLKQMGATEDPSMKSAP